MSPATLHWVIDTSSIIEVRRIVQRPHQAAVYSGLGDHVDHGVLVYPPEVLEELERTSTTGDVPDLPYVWAKKNAPKATRYGHLYDAAKRVLAQVPDVLDSEKVGTEEADPYVLATAVHMCDQGLTVTVLTEERRDRPDKMSMTTACGVLLLPAVPVATFLARQGIWPQTRIPQSRENT